MTLFVWHVMEGNFDLRLLLNVRSRNQIFGTNSTKTHGPDQNTRTIRTIGPHHLDWPRTIYEIIELVWTAAPKDHLGPVVQMGQPDHRAPCLSQLRTTEVL